MLTDLQRHEFDERGFVRIPSAFDAESASEMRRVAWGELRKRYGVLEADPATWTVERPSGLKNTKRHQAFERIGSEPVFDVFDELLGTDEWVRPRTWGQVMITFPNPAQPWVVPHGLWHIDFTYDADPAAPPVGLKVFAFFGDVAPQGGGTLLISGSHRLVARFVAGEDQRRADSRRMRLAFMRDHPWLRALATPDYDAGRTARFMDEDGDIDGLPARVVELTGTAGDIVITHAWTLHHIAYNAGSYPRFMRGQSIYRRDVTDPTESGTRHHGGP